MSILSAILLGILQGLTELFPVSSSGHLMLVQKIFQIDEADLFFDVMLHMGSLIALLISFRKEIRHFNTGFAALFGLGRDAHRTGHIVAERKRMAALVMISSLPLVVAPLLAGYVERIGDSILLMGIMFVLNGFIIHYAWRFRHKQIPESKITFKDALLVGLAQLVGVLPGISSCGITISVGTIRGFDKHYAIRYSYLLSIPAILSATVFTFARACTLGLDLSRLPIYLLGLCVSAIVGVLAVRLVKWVVARDLFGGFAYYCWGAGMIALILSLVS